ncbi:hypothetical protein DSTSK_24480 [Desulforhabdus sp. TSK]|nr:hypothetical protein DSTSK_24480 [Desulforhabdus sp. TSK]
MQCPVCGMRIQDELEVLCPQCGWEFIVYLIRLSSEEEALHRRKLEIARRNWNELQELRRRTGNPECTNIIGERKTERNRQGNAKATPKNTNHRIRFIDNGDGTVTDTKTRLMWQKKCDGVKRTWKEASEYAKGLRLGGYSYSEWRLPTVMELKSIVTFGYFAKMNEPAKSRGRIYWSSNEYEAEALPTFIELYFPRKKKAEGWVVDFNTGQPGLSHQDRHHHVRCVRKPGQ